MIWWNTATQPSNPVLPWYYFSGWYLLGSNTQFNFSTPITANTTLYARWRYTWTISDLNVYFIRKNGTTWYVSLMDRNLWATATWAWSSASSNSYGFYYQWWNNYWFPTAWTLSNTTYTQVPYATWSQYIPSKYASGVFVKWSYTWMLWWSGTDALWWYNGSELDRQWPCPDGYHIPTSWEYQSNVQNNYYMSTNYSESGDIMAWDFLIPYAGFRENTAGSLNSQSSYGMYWLSTPVGPEEAYTYHIVVNWYGEMSYFRIFAYPVRCFKNSATPALTIYPNGWNSALIITNNWIITKLWTPTKAGYTFWWWYKNSNFANQVYVWNSTSNITW